MTRYQGDEGISYTHWLLEENGLGERRTTRTGLSGNSEHCQYAKALVDAWKAGGPLPDVKFLLHDPEPTKAKLIAFPGGKTANQEPPDIAS
jgi:hypothetical protein